MISTKYDDGGASISATYVIAGYCTYIRHFNISEYAVNEYVTEEDSIGSSLPSGNDIRYVELC